MSRKLMKILKEIESKEIVYDKEYEYPFWFDIWGSELQTNTLIASKTCTKCDCEEYDNNYY